MFPNVKKFVLRKESHNPAIRSLWIDFHVFAHIQIKYETSKLFKTNHIKRTVEIHFQIALRVKQTTDLKKKTEKKQTNPKGSKLTTTKRGKILGPLL